MSIQILLPLLLGAAAVLALSCLLASLMRRPGPSRLEKLNKSASIKIMAMGIRKGK